MLMGRYAFRTAARNQDATGLMKPSVELRNAACVIAVQHRRMKKRAVGIKPLRQTRRFVGQQSSARACPPGTHEENAQLLCRAGRCRGGRSMRVCCPAGVNRSCLEHTKWERHQCRLAAKQHVLCGSSTTSAFTFTLRTTPTNRISGSLASSAGICEYPPISTASPRSDSS